MKTLSAIIKYKKEEILTYLAEDILRQKEYVRREKALKRSIKRVGGQWRIKVLIIVYLHIWQNEGFLARLKEEIKDWEYKVQKEYPTTLYRLTDKSMSLASINSLVALSPDFFLPILSFLDYLEGDKDIGYSQSLKDMKRLKGLWINLLWESGFRKTPDSLTNSYLIKS
jgi:hypothetical protein